MTTVTSLATRPLAVGVLVLSLLFAPFSGSAQAEESLRQLTDTTDYYYTHPSVSADGTRIAYWSAGRQEIYVVNGDGTGFRPLVGAPLQANGPPSLSANGLWMVFAAQEAGRGSPWYEGDIFLLRTDGTGLRSLTTSPRDTSEQEYQLAGARGNPAISGDGSLVVFASNADFAGQNADRSMELFALRADGSGLRQLTNFADVPGPNVGDTIVREVAFAPTVDRRGAQIAFFREQQRLRRTDGGAERLSYDLSLYIVQADGSGLRRLSLVSSNYAVQESLGEKPALSGDGSRVAFPAFLDLQGGNPRLMPAVFVIKTDGSGLKELSGSSSGRSAFPALSFDGSLIAFTHFDPDAGRDRYEVYTANADGSRLTRLTATPGDPITRRTGYEGVALSTDGSRVVFASSGDLLGRNADGNYELYVRRLTSLAPVQGIRNRAVAADLATNRHSLVARRDLVVRAFFDTGSGGPTALTRGQLVVDEGTPQQAILAVEGYLARPQGYFDDKPDARQRLEDSLNFFIAGQRADDLLTPGSHTFKARLEPQEAGAFTPWEQAFQATFRQADTVDIFIVPVRISATAGLLVAPDAALLPGAADFLRATYPLDENRARVRNIVLAPLDLNQPPNTKERRRSLAGQIRARLDAQLLAGQLANPARHNFVAGVLPNSVDGQNPLSGGLLGSTFPAIRGAVSSLDRSPLAPNPPVIGSTIAHEIGHNLGLGDEYAGGSVSPANPPPATAAEGTNTGNYVQETAGGLDTTNRAAVFSRTGAEVYGYMGGGNDRNSWATGTDYAFLYSLVTTDTVGVRAAAAAATKFINVSGVITQAGAVSLNPFLVATSPYSFTRPAGSQYALQFRGSSGTVLDTVSFDIEFVEDISGGPHQPVDAVPFSFTVPLPDGVASLAILTGTTPLISYTVSARPPTVTLLAPNGGESLRGPAQVRWQAADPDGDSLTYTVLYSPDGTDRYVVATNVATTTLSLDFSRLPASNQAYLIVRASDGFNASEDVSDAAFTAGPWQVFLPLVMKGGGGW